MRIILSLIFLCFVMNGARYEVSGGKAYLVDEANLLVITSDGFRRLPLFGVPFGVAVGLRPYVLSSEALFAVDAAKEEVSALLRLDRLYGSMVVGPGDRIYLLGGDALSVVQGSETRLSLLYTYGLPRLAGSIYPLSTGELLLTPTDGVTAMKYNPSTKGLSDVKLGWVPREPVLVNEFLVDRDSSGLKIFNTSTGASTSFNLGVAPRSLVPWKDKVIVLGADQLFLVDPRTSVTIACIPLPGAKAVSAVDGENLAVVLRERDLITFALPGLVPLDTFNAFCATNSSAYPFRAKPLFVCGEKLAFPGGTAETSAYLVQPVRPEDTGCYALQVGAFSNPASFGTLMEILARQGLPYYTIKENNLTKFRVGFFRTRAEADRVRSFLANIDSWIVTEKTPQSLIYSINDLNRDVRPDGIVAKGDSVLILTLRQNTWIEVLKASRLPEPVTEVYVQGAHAYARLQSSGLRELVLPDSTE